MKRYIVIFSVFLSFAISSCSKSECIQCSQTVADSYCETHFNYSAAKTAYGTWDAFKQVMLNNKDCKVVSH
jgi:hypothetical protein